MSNPIPTPKPAADAWLLDMIKEEARKEAVRIAGELDQAHRGTRAAFSNSVICLRHVSDELKRLDRADTCRLAADMDLILSRLAKAVVITEAEARFKAYQVIR